MAAHSRSLQKKDVGKLQRQRQTAIENFLNIWLVAFDMSKYHTYMFIIYLLFAENCIETLPYGEVIRSIEVAKFVWSNITCSF